MSTFDRRIAAEVAGAAFLMTAVVALFSPDDLWLTDTGFHPAWAVVLVFAARYGTGGLFLGLALTWGTVALASLALHGSIAGLATRAAGSSDLLALAAATLVAWIAMLHEGRTARVSDGLAQATKREQAALATVQAMEEVVSYLRARSDRIEVSLSVWRDTAARLEHGDAAEAAGAALELCVIRSGASAGIVHGWDGTGLHPVACRGPWSTSDPRPRDISADRTAMAAVRRRQPVRASEVEGVGGEDSDLAAPVIDDHGGAVLGVITLRGVAPSHLHSADVLDLVIIGRWLAPALAAGRVTRLRSGEGAC